MTQVETQVEIKPRAHEHERKSERESELESESESEGEREGGRKGGESADARRTRRIRYQKQNVLTVSHRGGRITQCDRQRLATGCNTE